MALCNTSRKDWIYKGWRKNQIGSSGPYLHTVGTEHYNLKHTPHAQYSLHSCIFHLCWNWGQLFDGNIHIRRSSVNALSSHTSSKGVPAPRCCPLISNERASVASDQMTVTTLTAEVIQLVARAYSFPTSISPATPAPSTPATSDFLPPAVKHSFSTMWWFIG